MPRGKIADRTKSPTCWEYYKTLEPNLSQKECEKLAEFRRKSVNKRTIEYYQKNFPNLSPEEQENMRIKFLKSVYENHPCHIEYYQKKFPDLSEEEQRQLLSQHMHECNSQNIKFFEKRYPELSHEEHLELLKKSKEYHMQQQPGKSGKNNPGHSSNCTALERRQRSPKCIEFYDLRYPDKTDEEKQEMLKAHLKKTANSLTPEKHQTKVEYWLAKGYSEEEAKQKIHERQQTFSLEKCIQKYGEEEGIKIFNKRQNKWQKSLKKNFEENGDGRTPQSLFANDLIDGICSRLEIRIPDKEKYITDKNTNKHYSYDFHYKNILIEFNGDYWHCNPSIYQPDFYNKSIGMTAQEKWNVDKDKIRCAEECGYKVLTIWESESKNDYSGTIDKCLKFIQENVVY